MWILRVAISATIALVAAMSRASAEDLPIIPNDTMTPGAVASTNRADVCGTVNGLTYSERHRQTSQALKMRAYAAYAVKASAADRVRDDDGQPIAVRRYSDNLLLALLKAH